ncbi:MAG TPA: ferrochelatase [Bacteroidota bacterium]|nr:ferrochelatase [Bacteroidota bacterium]
MSTGRKIAVVCLQLGGPDSLDAVEPFLYNLFCDPDIIDFPGAFLARRLLAKIISSSRSKTVALHYGEIGGKSPILELTKRQADALSASLSGALDADVFIAMRYWKPFTAEAASAIRSGGYDGIVLLPLYPQYSLATTASSLNEWNRRAREYGVAEIPCALVDHYESHPLYIGAIAENVSAAYARFSGIPPGDIDIIFSAHGIPLSLVNRGDPYPGHITRTVRSTLEQGRWPSPHHLCFQSKVGPAKWLKPSLNETVKSLAERGRKNFLIVPVAFVTEHIETLHEINIETREMAMHLGVERFEMMPALNDHPKFIACLKDLTVEAARTLPATR